MEQRDLAEDVKFVLEDNVLAFTSEKGFATVSSAIYNGGAKRVKAVLNVGVPKGYNDHSLHIDPLQLITSSAAKLGLTQDYLAMVTAANVHNYSLRSQKNDNFNVHVAATAGCQHGESSGETLDVHEIAGTINVIVLIDGNPTESCMVASIITATEAKSAALHDLDVRSRYTGDSATGSITDSVTVASTGRGKSISLGGPASKLGKLVGSCVRQAVGDALVKQEPFWVTRTILDRLKERCLSIETMAAEVSKVEGLTVTTDELKDLLQKNPQAGLVLLAAAKMDEDYKNNLLPADFKDWTQISRCICTALSAEDCQSLPGYESVNLPLFVKYSLINILKTPKSRLN